jgi:predicted metal-dependent phosphoesterase TrpH
VDLIDLHTHTDASDGSLEPTQLVDAAREAGISVLAITDHDTFAGFEVAVEPTDPMGLRLIRGIELTCDYRDQNVHLLAYFLDVEPSVQFREWLERMHDSRRERNRELAERLRQLGLDIHIEEVEKLGHHMTGRPHFARLLVSKGYAVNRDEAFERYIGESGAAYVKRHVASIQEAIRIVRAAGGVTSLAHPGRVVPVNDPLEDHVFRELTDAGLTAVEAYHSDHSAEDTRHYLQIAERFGLVTTGGSDFHGEAKPNFELGRGVNGNLRIPAQVMTDLEERSRALRSH